MPSITYKNATGGISQDDYRTKANSVLFSKGLNLQEQTYKVELGKTAEQELSTASSCECFAYVLSVTTKIPIVAGRDGDVYNVRDATDDTPDFTFASGNTVTNMINFNGKVYFLIPDGTNAIQLAQMDETNVNISGVDESPTYAGTLPDGINFGPTSPMYNLNDTYLYIGLGTKMVQIDKNNVITIFDIFEKNIVGIDMVGSVMRIKSTNGEITYWTPRAIKISENAKLPFSIGGSINYKANDIIFGKDGVHVLSGYTTQLLANKLYSEREGIRWKNYNSVDGQTSVTQDNTGIYFLSNDQGASDNASIWYYGSKISGVGDGFNFLLDAEVKFRAIYSLDNTLYFIDGKNIKALTADGVDGEMVYPILDGGDNTYKKQTTKLEIVTSKCSETNTIEILASYNNKPYVSIKTITDSTEIHRTTVTTDTTQWFDVTYKVKFTFVSGATQYFHSLRVVYDIIEE